MMLVWFGQVRSRLYGLAYWPIAVCAVVTPLLAVFALWGSLRTLLRRAAGWEIVALAWLPAAYLTFRTVVLVDFRPMARFAMVDGHGNPLAPFDAELRSQGLTGREAQFHQLTADIFKVYPRWLFLPDAFGTLVYSVYPHVLIVLAIVGALLGIRPCWPVFWWSSWQNAASAVSPATCSVPRASSVRLSASWWRPHEREARAPGGRGAR